jgi:hypothetical protein
MCDPIRGWMSCCVDPDTTSAGHPNDDEDVEEFESDAWKHKQVHGGNLRRVVAKEGQPFLRGESGRFTRYFAALH